MTVYTCVLLYECKISLHSVFLVRMYSSVSMSVYMLISAFITVA